MHKDAQTYIHDNIKDEKHYTLGEAVELVRERKQSNKVKQKKELGQMIKVQFIALFGLVFGLFGCTDTFRASVGAYGSSGHIECYSGTLKIYEGDSTGRIATVNSSDGWEFKEKGTDKFIRVSGARVIRN